MFPQLVVVIELLSSQGLNPIIHLSIIYPPPSSLQMGNLS